MSELAAQGPLLLALGIAALAGFVSFASPCILPLVPGYLSYVTGLAGAAEKRGRTVLGAALFVAGFTAVFITLSFAVSGLGHLLATYTRTVEIVVGVVTIGLGLAFAGLVPGLQAEWRIRRLPDAGLAGAPVLGAVFALGWTPCLSPTLTAVLGLGAVQGQVSRGVLLTVAYCVGLGLPFLLVAFGMKRIVSFFTPARRRWVTRIGGALLVLVGLALVTGLWGDFTNWLRATVGPGEVGI